MSLENTFTALSDQTRREILQLLKNGRMKAGEIASHFCMANASVSYHLSKLQEADLINREKEGNFIFYSLNTSVFEEVILWVKSFENGVEYEGNESV